MTEPQIDPVNVRKMLTGAIALPLIIMGLLAGVLFWQIHHLLSLQRWVEHTDQAIMKAHETQKLFLDMQIGWRGYALTGNPQFLEPFQSGEAAIDKSLNDLENIVSDNPEQLERLRQIREVRDQWLAFGHEVTALPPNGVGGQKLFERGRGEELRARLNKLFTEFNEVETNLRDVRTHAAQQATPLVIGTAVGLLILSGMLIALVSRKQLLSVSDNYRRALRAEQEQARALQESQERYQAFLHNSTEAIWRFEVNEPIALAQPEDAVIEQFYERGYLAECNDTLAQMYGYERANELVGARLGDMLVRSNPENEAYLRSFIRGGYRLEDAESVEHDREGRIKYFLNNLIGITEGGHLRRAWGTQRDITVQKQLEEERAQLLLREQTARAEAEAANIAKDEFLATLSHELRTPLTPIIGWVRMMDEGLVEGADYQRGLSVIKRNSLALSQLINDLLDMSAIMSGKLRVEKAPVRIETVIADTVETMRPFAASREVNLDLSLCENIADPPRIVTGDRTRLGQIFGNLLHNAIKFSERGGRVHISCEELTDGHIRVQVADEGQGINADFLPHVFERFRQEDSSTTRSHGGLGIGLALVKSFVEAHRGTVEALSAGEGHGSRMVVTLPLQQIGAPEFSDQENSVPSPSLRISTGNEQLHVLIVEDAEDTLAMLDTLFTRYNFVTTLCPTPEAALAAAADGQFEIIICDIGLPGMDGYELIKRFRQIPSLSNVPAVALTGFAGPKEQEKALAAGFDEHIAKPVTPPVLMAKLEELFRVKSGR